MHGIIQQAPNQAVWMLHIEPYLETMDSAKPRDQDSATVHRYTHETHTGQCGLQS